MGAQEIQRGQGVDAKRLHLRTIAGEGVDRDDFSGSAKCWKGRPPEERGAAPKMRTDLDDLGRQPRGVRVYENAKTLQPR